MRITRKMKSLAGGWTELSPVEGQIRTLEGGMLCNRIELSGVEKGAPENADEFYRTMVVNSTYIFGMGTIRYIGFVTKDDEEFSYEYNLEEWCWSPRKP